MNTLAPQHVRCRKTKARAPIVRTLLGKLRKLSPVTSRRRGHEQIVEFFEASATKRYESGDQAGGRYYAAHAAALRRATGKS